MNLQTRYIALDVDIVESIKEIDLQDFTKFNFHLLKEYSKPGIPKQKFIEIAKEHLSEFGFVGVTEKFDESLLLLCYTFDWIPIYNRKKINVAKKRQNQKDLPKDIIDAIKEKTNLDREIYDYGRLLFEQRYLEMVNELKEKYFENRNLNFPKTKLVYEMLKKRYIENHGKTKFFKENLQFNYRKINFIIRYGWKTRVALRLGMALKKNLKF